MIALVYSFIIVFFINTGLPPPISIGPNEDITCEIELLSIVPPLSKRYKSVGVNESLREELVEKIQSDESKYSPKSKQSNAQFFDPKKHKLDPNQRVSGVSSDRKYVWEENPRTIDLTVYIPEGCKKSDLHINIRY